ncbi:MAG: hypothetical protein SPK00_00800 [Corynebacterium glucuronolyticum]|nr:hypothetical protein [Corynebacterium glucuronolyticum]MDD7587330.1 hypothetical protein [Mycobacteriaceae bacterium]MDY5833285.1 hypothetical protein [Corynebacterium glucuronolyticum]
MASKLPDIELKGEFSNPAHYRIQVRNDFEEICSGHKTLGHTTEVIEFLQGIAYRYPRKEFCIDLDRNESRTFDTDGKEFPCYHFWGEQRVTDLTEGTSELRKLNEKEGTTCDNCWARNLCRACPALALKAIRTMPPQSSRCQKSANFDIVLEEFGRQLDLGQAKTIVKNFAKNFGNIGLRIGFRYE